MINKNLCDVLKRVRTEVSKNPATGKPLTQAAFAKTLNISQSAITEIENYKREPSKKLLQKIYEIYSADVTTAGQLLIFDSDRNSPLRVLQSVMENKDNGYLLSAKEAQDLRDQIKKLESERDDWREQARFLKGLLEGKK